MVKVLHRFARAETEKPKGSDIRGENQKIWKIIQIILERAQRKCIWYHKEEDSGIKCAKTGVRQSDREGPDFLIPDMSGMLSIKEVLTSAIFMLHTNSKRVDGFISL